MLGFQAFDSLEINSSALLRLLLRGRFCCRFRFWLCRRFCFRLGGGFLFSRWNVIADEAFNRTDFKNRAFGTAGYDGDGADGHGVFL
jgi:hypothetical protein